MSHSTVELALGRVASGIFILTVADAGQTTGMLASWVMQAGFEPPTISVAVKKERYVCQWLSSGAPFVLNIVPEHDKSLLKHFARGFEPGAEAFDGLQLTDCAACAPVLAEAVGHLECRPTGH